MCYVFVYDMYLCQYCVMVYNVYVDVMHDNTDSTPTHRDMLCASAVVCM